MASGWLRVLLVVASLVSGMVAYFGSKSYSLDLPLVAEGPDQDISQSGELERFKGRHLKSAARIPKFRPNAYQGGVESLPKQPHESAFRTTAKYRLKHSETAKKTADNAHVRSKCSPASSSIASTISISAAPR